MDSYHTAFKMPSSKNLLNLKVFCNLCNCLTFTLFPIVYKTHQQTFQINQKSSKKRQCFLLFNTINFFYVAAQFTFCVFNNNAWSQIQLLFRGLHFAFTVGWGIYWVGYYSRATEFCILLNILINNPGGLLHQNLIYFRKSNNLVTYIIVLIQLTVSITLVVFIPIVDISLTIYSQHISPICKVLSVMFTFVRLPCFLCGCVIGSLTISICFVVLKELYDNLMDLQMLQTKTFGNTRHINRDWLLETYYRRYQLFAMVINKCLQIHFLSFFQFVGAMFSIGISFTFLVYPKLLTLSAKIIMFLLLLAALGFNCFLLDFGSKSLFISERILSRGKAGLDHDNSKWLLKFVKSCSPISLRVGWIHKMNRESWPSFVRFVLQRTFFLVVKSRD